MTVLDVVLSVLPQWLVLVCFLVGFSALATYLVPVIRQSFFLGGVQDLKQSYGAQWALVTGGSSGIGKAIVRRLAQQGIHVVVVALDDAMMAQTMAELKLSFPQIEFRSVGVNLGATDPAVYMKPIQDATQDLPDLRLIFNNAGFILPGIFHALPLEKHMVNIHCNSTSAVNITHHFLNTLAALPLAGEKKRRGLISFTSSSAGFLPTPISALYGATKTFLTSFASAVATEVQEDGIDIVCVHPSPIDSNFYANAKGVKLLTSFQKTAMSPDVIAETIFKAAGRCTLRDQGYFSIGSKLLLKAVDWNFMSEMAPLFMKSNPDFRRLKAAYIQQGGKPGMATSKVDKEE